MSPEPVPAEPEWDDDPAWSRPDPMTAAEREAWLDRVCEQDEPPGEEEFEDFEPFTPDELAEVRQAARDDLLAVQAATTGRRGPGQPGSARVFAGESSSPAASFGPGMVLDVLPGCPQLAVATEAAAGDDDSFAGVSEAELVGVLCTWDRVEAHAAARKLAAVAELARRNPRPEDAEFTTDEIANALGESRARADDLLALAQTLQTHLPGTAAALLDGTISRYKAEIIARATAFLDEDKARAAEADVLDRAAQLTPGGLRAAIARAVMEVAPDKARQRRETAAKFARVERWAEDSGNAALMGRELPPDEVLAADQRICWWAGELRQAGLDGGMDELRARAYLDLLLGKDSRPRRETTAGGGGDSAGRDRGPGGSPPAGPAGGAGAWPAGFAGRVTLTVPLATLAGLADRPGELAGLGPVRTQKPRQARRPRAIAGPDRVHLHRRQPGRPTRRIRHLDTAHPCRGTGPANLPRPDRYPGLRSPVRRPRPRPGNQAPAPELCAARHLYQSGLPSARRPVRLRAQHPVRGRRPDLPVQRRSEMSARPPAQAEHPLDGRPAPRRHLPLDHPRRPQLRHRTHPLPHLMNQGKTRPRRRVKLDTNVHKLMAKDH
jgi:hypothetical protein